MDPYITMHNAQYHISRTDYFIDQFVVNARLWRVVVASAVSTFINQFVVKLCKFRKSE